jgi:uncharacterized membrane protein YkvA (DUF1232 family)
VVVGYAFSPIDLIPDPIPVLGYLDDLLLIPLGVYLALKLIPAEVMADCQERARQVMMKGEAMSVAVAVVIVLVWLGLASLVGVLVWRWITKG